MSDFAAVFTSWANNCFAESIPTETIAFSFNLYETSEGFGIELVGTDEFDLEDSDWACSEIFEPSVRGIDIPNEVSGEKWEECLDAMKTLVLDYILSKESGALSLNEKFGVGIGFVDRDLSVLLSPPYS